MNIEMKISEILYHHITYTYIELILLKETKLPKENFRDSTPLISLLFKLCHFT